MDVDIEPLESQAYRRSKEAAKLIVLPTILNQSTGDIPKRRRSNRTLRPVIYSTDQKEPLSRRRSSAIEKVMDYPTGYQMGMGSSSKSGSPSRMSRGSENPELVPVKYTPITGRVSKAKKGVPVHTCEQCRPVKVSNQCNGILGRKSSFWSKALECVNWFGTFRFECVTRSDIFKHQSQTRHCTFT